uniref:Uncharacterized protein n=1 Tax=Arundo donax TaxID=35708 RepID=A0A0A9CEK8_ARUDO
MWRHKGPSRFYGIAAIKGQMEAR